MEKTEDAVKLSTGKTVRIHTWPMRPGNRHIGTFNAMPKEVAAGAPPIPEALMDGVVAAIADGCDLPKDDIEALALHDALALFVAIGGLNCRPLLGLFSPQRSSKKASSAPPSN